MDTRTFIGAGFCILLSACGKQPSGDSPDTASAAGHKLAGSNGTVSRLALLEDSGGQGGFVKLRPEECGIDFLNEVSDPVLLQQEIHLQSGVAAGDYDADGDIDLFLLGLQTPNRLYRNDGDMHFTDVTEQSGAGLDGGEFLGSGAQFADLTGDGILDLLVSNRVAPNQFFRGTANHSFTEESAQRGLDDDRSTVSAAVFDMENDGDLDVYFTNYRHSNVNYHVYLNRKGRAITGAITDSGEPLQIEPDLQDLFYISESGEAKPRPQADSMLRNDGSGQFSDVTSECGLQFEGWSFQPQACDFNDDGFTDLYVSSDFETPDHLFLNDGKGAFKDVTREHIRRTPMFSMGCDTGDVNGDGLPDLMTADMSSLSYERSKRQSGDMYEWRWEMLYAKPQPQMRNMLYLNQGDAWMSEIGQYAGVASSEWTWAVRFADLNCNGTEELFVTNGMLKDSMDVDMRRGAEQLLAKGASDEELSSYWASLDDYLTDNIVFEKSGDGSLQYSRGSADWGLDGATMSCGVIISDLDGDGDPDMVINNTNDKASVYRNDKADGNRLSIDLRQAGPNSEAVGARLHALVGDRQIMRDVIISRGFASGESSRVFIGLGDSSAIDRLEIRWPDGKLQEVADLAAGYQYTIHRSKDLRVPDKQPDPMFAELKLDYVATEVATDDEEFAAEPLLPFQQSTQGPGAAVADFNADGHLDAYFCGPAGTAGELLYGDGTGMLRDSGLKLGISSAVEEMSATVFDANADGLPDLYISAGGMEADAGAASLQDSLLINHHPDGFVLAALPVPATSTGTVCPLDYDSDGDLDLIVCAHLQRHAYAVAGSNYLLINDGSGGFSMANASQGGAISKLGLVKDMQAAQLDSDNNLDLVIARDWGGIAVMYGNGAGFDAPVDIAPNGWWRGLCLLDADCDGDLDIACANSGANIKYHPKEDRPVLMVANDFDGNGTRDLVEVKWKGAEMMPGRGRSCSGYAINFIPKRFETWKSFANASLQEIYGSGLDGAEQFTTDLLDSVLCSNDGKRGFTLQDLPESTQLLYGFGACSADFNADGNPDLFVGGNFSATQPETGTWNAGYGSLLMGNGKGGFSAVAPKASGILLYQDVRTCLAADMNEDGLMDIVVSASNDSPRVLLNRSVAASDFTVHEISQATGEGPGANIVLSLSDGRKLNISSWQASYLGSCIRPLSSIALPGNVQVENEENAVSN